MPRVVARLRWKRCRPYPSGGDLMAVRARKLARAPCATSADLFFCLAYKYAGGAQLAAACSNPVTGLLLHQWMRREQMSSSSARYTTRSPPRIGPIKETAFNGSKSDLPPEAPIHSEQNLRFGCHISSSFWAHPIAAVPLKIAQPAPARSSGAPMFRVSECGLTSV